MVAIGRALMARPKLLLLDEPSMGLAPIFVERIFEIIREINSQGTPILLVEQNALMALDVAKPRLRARDGQDRARRRREGAEAERGRQEDVPRRSGLPRDVPAVYDVTRAGSRAGKAGSPRGAGGPTSRAPSSARRRCRASGRSRAAALQHGRGSPRSGHCRGGRSRGGSRPSPRTAAADDRSGRCGTPAGHAHRAAAGSASASADASGRPTAARRREERAVGLLRRVPEVPLEAVQQDRGPALRDRERVAPQPQGEPEPEVRAQQRVRTLAREVRRRARHADADSVELAGRA